jgi:hypothetical protein
MNEPATAMTEPATQLDTRLFGVWSRDHLSSIDIANDCRMIFMPNQTGRYETWAMRLNEVITFTWEMVTAEQIKLDGCEYHFRDTPGVRIEPCDWKFPIVPYTITTEQVAAGCEMPVLRMHFGGGRCDHYGLVATDLRGWEGFHF